MSRTSIGRASIDPGPIGLYGPGPSRTEKGGLPRVGNIDGHVAFTIREATGSTPKARQYSRVAERTSQDGLWHPGKDARSLGVVARADSTLKSADIGLESAFTDARTYWPSTASIPLATASCRCVVPAWPWAPTPTTTPPTGVGRHPGREEGAHPEPLLAACEVGPQRLVERLAHGCSRPQAHERDLQGGSRQPTPHVRLDHLLTHARQAGAQLVLDLGLHVGRQPGRHDAQEGGTGTGRPDLVGLDLVEPGARDVSGQARSVRGCPRTPGPRRPRRHSPRCPTR